MLTALLVATIILFIGFIVLAYFFYSLYTHYNRLVANTDSKKLQNILEEILQETDVNKKNIAFLKTKYDTLEEESLYHIQKIGLTRFNPFNDTGGDQSFIVTLLNAKDSGVIISGLYSRSGTRWYAKRVIDGKGVEHDLSAEEKKALQTATSSKK